MEVKSGQVLLFVVGFREHTGSTDSRGDGDRYWQDDSCGFISRVLAIESRSRTTYSRAT